jgi:GcrA cell cycle regulator
MIWDDAAKKKLAKLWASGLSCSQIAKEMGVTRNAIIGKANRMKLQSRKVIKVALSYKIVRKAPKDTLYKAKQAVILIKAFKPKRKEPKQIVPVFRTTSDAVMALQDYLCKYPYGEPGKPLFRFCLKLVDSAGSYCPKHKELCFQPLQPRRGGAGKL